MNTPFSTARLPKACNNVLLLALGLVVFAAPSFATTVSLDSACFNLSSASNCNAGEKLLRAKLDRTFSGHASFRNTGNNALLTQHFDFDDAKESLHRIIASSLKNHGRINSMKNAIDSDHELFPTIFRQPFADYSVLHAALMSSKRRMREHPHAYDNDFSEVFGSEVFVSQAPAVPVPAAAWLFASGLFGLVGVARRRKHSST